MNLVLNRPKGRTKRPTGVVHIVRDMESTWCGLPAGVPAARPRYLTDVCGGCRRAYRICTSASILESDFYEIPILKFRNELRNESGKKEKE